MAEHGTVARYKKHIRDKDPKHAIDQACRDAASRYQKDLMQSNPQTHEDEKKRKRAVSRALTRLRNTFQVEYEVYYKEELAKENAPWPD